MRREIMVRAERRWVARVAALPLALSIASCTAERADDIDDGPIARESVEEAAEGADQQCWLVDAPVPLSDIHVVVRTVNTAGGAYPRYPIRLWGIAEAFSRDGTTPNEIIGVQEAPQQLTGCPSGPSEAQGTDCFARVMAEHGLGSTSAARSTAGGSNQIGIVVGGNWDIISSHVTDLGRDHWVMRPRRSWITPRLTRRLLEAKVRHKEHGWILRFYTTHLSQGVRQRQQRLEQIDRLVEIVTSRVGDGELPPIVAGDLNFRSGEAESYERMSRHFELVNALAVGCLPNGYPTDAGRDHVWVGRPVAFPQTRGSFVPLRYHTTADRGGGIDLKSRRTVVPPRGSEAYMGPLSDHHSPALSFTVADGLPDPGAAVSADEASEAGLTER